MASQEPILRVDGLSVAFGSKNAPLFAARDVSFDLIQGRTLCLVGESGSGKSISAMAVMGLLPRNAKVTARSMTVEGQPILAMNEARLAKMRGEVVSMIFQDPMSSLNPSLTVGFQITEAIHLHKRVGRAEARKDALDMLDRMRIPDGARRFGEYPHQLSGGMRQRVMIAMALVCRPKVLIADEPTTALDVTVQAQILELVDELKRDFGTAVLFITHDLGVVAELADDVAVMYAGRIVEKAPVMEVFDNPSHGYTLGLLSSLSRGLQANERLTEIPGNPPRLDHIECGCAFAPRCVYAEEACVIEPPKAVRLGHSHLTLCRRHFELSTVTSKPALEET